MYNHVLQHYHVTWTCIRLNSTGNYPFLRSIHKCTLQDEKQTNTHVYYLQYQHVELTIYSSAEGRTPVHAQIVITCI